MNLTLPQVAAMGAGALLIYSAVKGQSPISVLKGALTQSPGSSLSNKGFGSNSEQPSTGNLNPNVATGGTTRGTSTNSSTSKGVPVRAPLTLKTGV